MFYSKGDISSISVVETAYFNVKTIDNLYVLLQKLWKIDTCAPRLREKWSENCPSIGQCSITSFLVQDIFGGDVYGVILENGDTHCFNVIDNCVIDLTSEQFGDLKLDYTKSKLQSRDIHFSKQEKLERYLLLKVRLQNQI